MIHLIFYTILLMVSYQDLKKRKIPDFYIVILFAAGIVYCLTVEHKNPVLENFFLNIPEEMGLSERIVGAFCISLPMFLITFFVPGAFGGGDIKLMAACGFYLGPVIIVNAAVIGVLFAAIYGAFCILIKKADKNTRIPMGPFLSMGMLISTLWEPALLLFFGL